MSKNPLFTFVVPVFNPGGKLALTINSIRAEGRNDIEIWVQDGGSDDGTVEYLHQQADVGWQSERDEGLYDAMNRGIHHTTGSWLLFYGAGDTLEKGSLAEVEAVAIRYRDKAHIIYGDTWFVDENRRRGGVHSLLLLRKTMPCHQSTLYSRKVIDEIGVYNCRYKISADYAYDIVCWGSEKIVKTHCPVVIGRYEGGGMSHRNIDETFWSEHLYLVRKHLGLLAWIVRVAEIPLLGLLRWAKNTLVIIKDNR